MGECNGLTLTTAICTVTLFVSIGYHGSVAAMPGRLPAVRYLLETCGTLKLLEILWSWCIQLLLLAAPLVAARMSALAFFGGMGANLFMGYKIVTTFM